MNPLHWHLVLNHLPVVGTLLSSILLAYAWWLGPEPVRKVALGGSILVAVLAIPSYLSGDAAKDSLQKWMNAPEETVNAHEDAADVATIATAGAGLLAALALAYGIYNRDTPRWTLGAVFVTSAAALGLMGWAAGLGGKIRHPEATGRPDLTIHLLAPTSH